jgi:hypothetical protein
MLNENENKNQEENDQETTPKTQTKSGVLFSQLQQKFRNYEAEKSYTVASILKQFILIQLTFNRQSQRVFACAYKCLTNTFVEFDISKELYRICKDLYYPDYKYIFRNFSPSWSSSSPSPPPKVTVSQPQMSKKAPKTSLSTPIDQPAQPQPPTRTSSVGTPRQLGSQESPSTSSLSQQTPSQIQLLEQMKKMQPKAALNEFVAKLPPPSPNKQTRKQVVSMSPVSSRSRSETIANSNEFHYNDANKNANNSSLNNLILSNDFASSNHSIKLNKTQSYEMPNDNEPTNRSRLLHPKSHSENKQVQYQQQSTRQMMSNLRDSIKQNIMNMMRRNTSRPTKDKSKNKAAIQEYKFVSVDEEVSSSLDETVEYDSFSLRSLGSDQERFINLKIDEWIRKNANKQGIIPSTPLTVSSQCSDRTSTLTNTTAINRNSPSKLNLRLSTDTLLKEKKRAHNEFHHYENVHPAFIDQNSNRLSKVQDLREEEELLMRFNKLRSSTIPTVSTSTFPSPTQSYKTNSNLETYGTASTRALYVSTEKQPYGSESNIARGSFRPLSNNLLRIMSYSEKDDYLQGNQNKLNYRNTLSTVSSVDSRNSRSNSNRSNKHFQTNRNLHETRL